MRNAPPILCLLLFAALAWPAAAASAPRVQTPGSSQPDKVPAPAPAAKSPASKPPAKSPAVAAPAKPGDVKPRAVKPSGGSQGEGVVQDPRAREPTRPRLPPFDKRKGIQALHEPPINASFGVALLHAAHPK